MSLYNYIETPNNNLICCICRAPFTQPVTTRTCAHTFCSDCILLALSHSPLCPVDRSPLTQADLAPASPIVQCMVDELMVECVHAPEGCKYTGQRQAVPRHLKEECEWGEVQCEEAGCGEVMMRREVGEHWERVHEKKKEEEGQEEEDKECAEGEEEGEERCPHHEMGCPYEGNGKEDHLKTCPFESLKEFIAENNRKMCVLKEQNVLLRNRVEVLESSLQSVRGEMKSVRGEMAALRESVVGLVAGDGRRDDVSTSTDARIANADAWDDDGEE
ncbi:hypothetical protein CPC08DRAFT_813799 [Agrocybe pediades]|nr:hypothetical protein CPC08DRAFT_813799 [Agrocybe pediades]